MKRLVGIRDTRWTPQELFPFMSFDYVFGVVYPLFALDALP